MSIKNLNLKTVLLLLLVLASCKDLKNTEADSTIKLENTIKDTNVNSELEVYDFNGFETFLNKKDDKIYVINFWATWCAPCIKELPYFEQLNSEYNSKNVEVLLVSLDFPHLYETKLKPFIKKKNIQSKVVALDDVDMNTWIPKIDETWSGSLPATLIYNKSERKFFEQSFTFEALETEVKHFLN